jgi:replication factor C small subunit
LVSESVEFDIDTLDSYVKATYPDLRKCIQLLQQNSVTGQLNIPGLTDRAAGDWKLDCVQLFKSGQLREARTLICQQSTPEETEDIFRWMYDNLDLWSRDMEKQDEAIIIIKNGMANMPLVADQEINLSATLVELCRL